MKNGGISVQTENIFPVIKKWLYSDKDIFVRELVSNACDAITKYKRLVSLGETEEVQSDYKIVVTIDKELKTLKFGDNGIGMTEDEIDKYINQIALSGALDFIAKYEGEDSKGGGIIGHFGLGFYSAFMVADSVEIETKSFKDESATSWECKDSGEYSLEDGDKEARGTEIILHISDSELEYLDFERIKTILVKYCGFMPYPVYCVEGDKEELINDTAPAWLKAPSAVTGDEYNNLYKKLFNDFNDPLFCVHINADYPLNFKGILYFPAEKASFEQREGSIKLFYNSVFVADNIKEIVPDFMYNLCGVFDCPELPLNVSRSYLQDDSYVRKLSAHVVKKFAERINKLKIDDFDAYSKIWQDLKPYVEYGSMKDSKFYDKVKQSVLLKSVDDRFVSLSDIVENLENEKKIYYTTDVKQQAYYISLFSAKEIPVYVMDALIDPQFASFVESKNEKVKFVRVDASLDDIGSAEDSNDTLAELFSEVSGKSKEKISFVALGKDATPALLRRSEQERRFSDMMRMYMRTDAGDTAAADEELVINTESASVQKLNIFEGELRMALAKHIYLMAVITNRQPSAEEIHAIIENDAIIINNIN